MDLFYPSRLTLKRFLDPRPREEAERRPIADAVNLPLDEIADRLHELPPREETVWVAGPPAQVHAACALLTGFGRSAEPAADWQYGEIETLGRLWRPNPLLEEIAPTLAPGVAVDWGCGGGREVVYLASLGWRVVGIDHREDALHHARILERSCRAALDAPIEWVRRDLERNPEPTGRFNLAVMFRYLNRPLLKDASNWLLESGSLVVETFTTLHRERNGKPLKEQYVLRPGELAELAESLAVRHFEEAWRGEAHTARLWAVREGV